MYDRLNESVKNILLEFSNSELHQQWAKTVAGDYSSFIQQLKNWANDPKLLNFLKSGKQDGKIADDKFTVSNGTISCSQLIPTQNEIDLEKSLSYPLKSAQSMQEFLAGNDVVIAGAPIIVFNGKYIIDGHHRWSQVYCINPNATMKVINFTKKNMSPQDMLKATQVAIAITSGDVPTQTVEGKNLLSIPPKDIYKYVVEKISEEAATVMADSKENAAKQIALNCAKMQKNNRPISGAPDRSLMPQTNEPAGNISNVINALSTGITQISEPFSKTQKQENKIMPNKNTLNEGMIRLGTVSQKINPSGQIIQIAKEYMQELQQEKWTVGSQGYYWENFTANNQSGPAIGFIVGSENVRVKVLNTNRQVTYSDGLLYNVVKSGKLEAPILLTSIMLNETKDLNEDLSNVLNEESDDTVDQADPVTMFQDFTDIAGSLADIYSTLVTYQTSYVQNPKVQQAITSITSGVQQLMKQTTQTMSVIGAGFGLKEKKELKNKNKR
jgi:hypothetical protein